MTVRVEIYEVGEDGWLLEVVDDYGILRFYNYVNHIFNTDPASFEPIFWRGVQWGAAEWSEGFIAGFMFNEAEWSLLSIGQPTWFTPFLRVGTDEGIDITKSAHDAETWMNGIEPSLVRINAYWKDRRANQPAALLSDDYHHHGRQKEFTQVVRGGPKIGRNDPCPHALDDIPTRLRPRPARI